MKCLTCEHWKGNDWQYTTGLERPEYNDAECEKISSLIEIELECKGYGCGGEYVDEVWTNQDFFCAGYKERK